MKEDIRKANKAAADAVRRYLETLGMPLTHVQALEVIARGNNMRSRHLLAEGAAATPVTAPGQAPAVFSSQMPATRVSYVYIDGSNSKRSSSMTFRGRLTKQQLLFIESKLDDGLYFVPVQIGFESLQLAFTDDGGDDHYWHKLELGNSEDWVLDSEGFVLEAGDISQVQGSSSLTDADCDNLVWRFARVLEWDESLQEDALTKHVYQRPEFESVENSTITELVESWRQCPELAQVDESLLRKFAGLLNEGFEPVDGLARELRREIGPNAYQFCMFEPAKRAGDPFQVNYDISTTEGGYLTESPVVAVSAGAGMPEVHELVRALNDQAKLARSLPAVYDAAFA